MPEFDTYNFFVFIENEEALFYITLCFLLPIFTCRHINIRRQFAAAFSHQRSGGPQQAGFTSPARLH